MIIWATEKGNIETTWLGTVLDVSMLDYDDITNEITQEIQEHLVRRNTK